MNWLDQAPFIKNWINAQHNHGSVSQGGGVSNLALPSPFLDFHLNQVSLGSKFHVSTDGGDTGMWILVYKFSGDYLAYMIAGAMFDGTNWIAKDDKAAFVVAGSGALGGLAYYADTGLTPGNTFTPTLRWQADGGGITKSIGGSKRTTSDFTITNSTTLTNITGLAVNLAAGKTYAFKATLPVDASAGDHQYAIGGTCTATAIIYDVISVDMTAKTIGIASRQTALGGAASQINSSVYHTEISGEITVNAAGTLVPQFANASVGQTATVKSGAHFMVDEIA